MSNIGTIRDASSGAAAGVAARAQTPTGNALQVQIGPGDVISYIPVVMDYEHHQIHEGETYVYCDLQTGGLSSGSNYDIRLKSPNLPATTQTPHLLVEIIASDTCEVYLHETVTWTSGGTAATAYNRNRNSTNTPGMALYVNGGTALTVNSVGTVVHTWYLVAGKLSSASDRSVNEIDLKTNVEYMLRLTSRASGLKFLIRLNWYEDLGV
jgi:hypothetical protein